MKKASKKNGIGECSASVGLFEIIKENFLRREFTVFYLRNFFLQVLSLFLFLNLSAQQIDIPRINTMPDFPQPYYMLDWKAVAVGYDSLVFNQDLQGQFMPFVFFREQSVNYPAFPSFGLHTAVGTNYPTSGEGINAIPAVVGATLVGIDKTDQFNQDWAQMIQEFFNKRPAENIYLNHPVTSSGHDWWYETMPNIFFMQLKHVYPDIEVFHDQLPVMANQWLRAVRAMGGSDTPWAVPYMNYRAWNMSEMEPLDQGVKQPEAAGALAWILYNSYVATGNREFLKGAEWSMEFLDDWEQNPSYELQLPYGVYTAARMNAEIGTNYDVEKMLNWTFDRGPLRGWGAISGNWGGYDCHGLIGEANDTGNDYAFMMNGYQQAAALVPMLRYDHRFARAVAKWVLNMANASRLFYPIFLPENMQDNADWAQTYDPESFIGYEALREIKHGMSPYMTGDAMDGGWAQTNLMLYGSSHVGYLAAIVDTTEVEGILQLDLLKTDFYGQEAYPTYLYYNPFNNVHLITLNLPEGTYKIYDIISKQFLSENQSEFTTINVPAKNVVMPVLVPQDANIVTDGKRTYADGVIIDFDNGQPAGNLPPRIKALAALDTIIVTGGSTQIFCTATDPQDAELLYHWFMPDGESFTGEDQIMFSAPQETGIFTISSKVTNTFGLSDSISVKVEVVEKVPYDPEILSLKAYPRKIRPSEQSQLVCIAEDYYDDPLTYEWHAGEGNIIGENGNAVFTAPGTPGNYYISCKVTNPDGLFAVDSILVMVRDFPDSGEGNLIAFYPLRGNVDDYSGNALDGTAGGGLVYVPDMNNRPNSAASFNGTSAHVLLPDSELFGFEDALSLTVFLKTDELTPHEQHPVSHGSWEHRFKVSIGNQRIRFTLNTSEGIKDLDTESLIEPGVWYFLSFVYNGEDMEIWIDGELDAFTSHVGKINQSPVRPVLGQNIPGNNNYNFKGAMTLLNIYDFPLSPGQIAENLSLDIEITEKENKLSLLVFPNPVNKDHFFVQTETKNAGKLEYQIIDLSGRLLQSGSLFPEANNIFKIPLNGFEKSGVYFLKIISGERSISSPFILVR